MTRLVLLAALALGACTDAVSAVDDVLPSDVLNIAQVYKCSMLISIGDPSDVEDHSYSEPCLASEDDESAYESAWIVNVCTKYLDDTATTLPGKGNCSIDCYLKDSGWAFCTTH